MMRLRRLVGSECVEVESMIDVFVDWFARTASALSLVPDSFVRAESLCTPPASEVLPAAQPPSLFHATSFFSDKKEVVT